MRLYLCDTLEEFEALKKKKRKKSRVVQECVIGTYNIEFYRYIKIYMPEFKSEFLEYQGENKNGYVTDVLKDINNCICADCKKKYLFETGYSIEGSGLAQRVIDVLCEAEICAELYQKYIFDELFLFCNLNNCILVEIFREIAQKECLKFSVCYGTIRNIKELFSRILMCNNKLFKCLKIFYYHLGIMLRFFNIFLKAIKNIKYKKQEEHKYDLGRIWFSDALKHYNWGKEKLKEFDKNFTINIICAGTKKEVCKRFRKDNLHATQFEESYIYFGYTIKQITEYYRQLVYIKDILKKYRLSLNGIDISNLIVFRIRQHILLEVSKAVCIECIAKGYFEKNKFTMMEGWMGSNSIYTRIFYYNTRDIKTVFFRVSQMDMSPLEPVIFEEVEPNIIEIRFFCGNGREKICEAHKNTGWKGEAYLLEASVGKLREESQKKKKRNYVILWAPSYPTRGYVSQDEWERINETVLAGLINFDCKIYAKYHINQSENSINKTKNKFHNRGVIFINKAEAIEKYIMESDIILTTPSTVIYDSMLLDRIVIAVTEKCLLKMIKEVHFVECDEAEKAVDYAKQLMINEDRWSARLEEQRKFVKKYLDSKVKDVNASIADCLRGKIC